MILLPLNMLYNFLSTFYLEHFTIQLVNKNCQQKKYLAGIFKQYCLINIVDIYHYHENTKPLTNKMTQNKKHPTCRRVEYRISDAAVQRCSENTYFHIYFHMFIFIAAYFQNTFSQEHLWVSASGISHIIPSIFPDKFQTCTKVEPQELANSRT